MFMRTLGRKGLAYPDSDYPTEEGFRGAWLLHNDILRTLEILVMVLPITCFAISNKSLFLPPVVFPYGDHGLKVSGPFP
jgi:hypothetical protein